MRRRVFVDCFAIDFSRQPTGIPRVVMKYLQLGYEWGRAGGYEVIPVVPTSDGLWVVRPLPEWLSLKHQADLAPYLVPVGHLKTFFRSREKCEPAKIVPRRGDILFCPAYWHDVEPAYYRALRQAGVFVVTLVHDLLPIIFHNCYNSPWRDAFKANAVAAIGNSDLILTVSTYTLNATKELALRSNKPMPPSAVAYNGFEPLTHAPQPIFESYIGSRRLSRLLQTIAAPLIMVGSIEPKKAHIPVISALEQMWDAGFDRALVIVGRRGWLEEPIVRAIEGSSYFNRKLFWFYDLDDTDLALCYTMGHALIFASLGEGFGIPMIEACHYGMPVIVFDTEIAHEVLGSIGIFFESQQDFVDAILRLEMPAEHQRAAAGAKTHCWPHWEEVAPKAFDLMVSSADRASS